jgi:hypothetical protein
MADAIRLQRMKPLEVQERLKVTTASGVAFLYRTKVHANRGRDGGNRQGFGEEHPQSRSHKGLTSKSVREPERQRGFQVAVP